MLGKRLAHYAIVEELGRGGMGEVYVAEDQKLGRRVALKILPPLLAQDENLRARFEREAKVIASLNHPNIVHVYSVEELEGVRFFTMELVRGKTLSQILKGGRLSLVEFLEIAIPLADAVSAAHAEGITHRDLKPDNVMLSEEGRVKVLDFGLAKPALGLVDSQASDATTVHRTRDGRVLGTLSYMSPEQAAGKLVDPRSDIFSLGIVFFEMLTAEKPFKGDNPATILSSVIKDTPPPVDAIDPSIPRELVRIVKRCLVKDPDRRFQSTKDLRNELEELKQEVVSGGYAASSVPRRRIQWLLLAALPIIAAVLGVAVYRLVGGRPQIPRVANPTQVTSDIGLEDYPTWSPDGGRLAYFSNQSGNFDIWVTQAAGGSAVNLTADSTGAEFFPSWSPDGTRIAYAAHRDQSEGGGCYVIPALGGPPRRVATSSFLWARPQWSSDGGRLACGGFDGTTRQIIQIVDVATLEATRFSVRGQYEPVDLSWSPDGRFIAYVDASNYTADMTHLWILRLSDGEVLPLSDGLTAVWSPIFSADSRTLWYVSNRGGSMDVWRQGIGGDGTPEGAAQPITTGLDTRSMALFADGSKIAYSRGRRIANVWRVPILHERPASWGDAEPITFDQAFIEFLDVSPGGDELLINSNRGGFVDIWKLPASGGTMQPLTDDQAPDWNPRWSPDGRQVAFYSYRGGQRDVWVLSIEGGPARQLTLGEETAAMPAWSPDGSEIAYVSIRDGNFDLAIVSAAGGSPRALASGPREESQPEWSPDGEWIVFASDRDGAYGLWRVAAEGGEPERLSERPGARPFFSPGGREILFNGLNNNVWALSLDDRSERQITDLADKRGELGFYALATDGQYLYFTWVEDRSDIWTMDVISP
ncbi:MAG TPA: protein kinase [Vicinamibacteria bacterium]|nr:protein kinase [Vicinamibacteria bacterium]